MTGHNQRSSSATVARITRRGFNLIEAAIVLAVVGGVIGGIWVSAATVYENYKVNKTVRDLALIVKNVQGLISVRDANEITFNDITATLKNAGVFPKDWINGAGSLRSPFGGHVGSWRYTVPSTSFNIQLANIPRASCIKLLTAVSEYSKGSTGGWGEEEGLKSVQVNYPDWSTGTFPISLQQAETACTSATNNNIYFYYGFTRINN